MITEDDAHVHTSFPMHMPCEDLLRHPKFSLWGHITRTH
jgi:hypothetical protein